VGTYTTKWGYDPYRAGSVDRVASLVYPSGETVYTTYNAQGLAISLDSTRLTRYASPLKCDEAGGHILLRAWAPALLSPGQHG